MNLNLIVNQRVWEGTAAQLAVTATANYVFPAGDQIYQIGDFTRVKTADGVTTLANLPWSPASGNSNRTLAAVPITATLTAAQVKSGISSTSAGTVSATLPSAASILALLKGGAAGSSLDFIVDNSGGVSVVTVVASASITAATAVITGGATLTVAAGAVGRFWIYFSSGTVAKIYRVG